MCVIYTHNELKISLSRDAVELSQCELASSVEQRFFPEPREYTKRELHDVRVGNLGGGRRLA